MSSLFHRCLILLIFCGLPDFTFALSEQEIHDRAVLTFRKTSEKIYNENIKIKFHNRPIGTDGSTAIDPYGMKNFPLEGRNYDIFCYFRGGGLPEVFLLSGETLHLYKETSSHNINKGTRDLFSRNNREAFYNNLLFFWGDQTPPRDIEICDTFDGLKLSEDLKNEPFTYEAKEKKISPALASKLINTWKNLKALTPRETNKIHAYENVFSPLDTFHRYPKSIHGMSFFEVFLFLKMMDINSDPDKFDDLLYLRRNKNEDSTLYELGCENKLFGVILPATAYTEDLIPYQTADLLEFIRNGINSPQEAHFESLLEKKLAELDNHIKNLNSIPAHSFPEKSLLSHYHKSIETIFEDNYKPLFPNKPLFLPDDDCPLLSSMIPCFENEIFVALDKSDLRFQKFQKLFCASYFDDETIKAFYLKKNILVIYTTDPLRKNKLEQSLEQLREQIESIVLNAPGSTPEQNRTKAEKIMPLLKEYKQQLQSKNKYLIRKEIEIPSVLAADLKRTWQLLQELRDNGTFPDVYKTHFPRLFGANNAESCFQTSMKGQQGEETANPRRYMVSLLGCEEKLFALNLPSCFYLTSEIPYQINTVISQIYLLNQKNTEDTRKILKDALSGLQENLQKELISTKGQPRKK